MMPSIPFEIAPDAEAFLRDRINETPPETQPLLVRATSQTDGLKQARWFHQGESFMIDRGQSMGARRKDCAEFEILGRVLAVDLDALKYLSGRVLDLRKVDSQIGLFRNPRFVLVAAANGLPRGNVETHDLEKRVRNYLSIAALTLLGGFAGMGAIWLAYGVFAVTLNFPEERLFAPGFVFALFAIGWILGAIASFIFFASIFKNDGRSEYSRDQMQKKYLGGRTSKDLDWWVFLGIPAPIIILAILALNRIALSDEQKAYMWVVALMVILGGTMYICDQLPHRLISWLGGCGWLCALTAGYCFFRLHGS